MLGDANALLNDFRAEFLHGECTNVSSKLADDGVAETVIVQVEDILHNLEQNVNAWKVGEKYNSRSCRKDLGRASKRCT